MELTITLWSVLWTDNFYRTKVEDLPEIEETGVSPFFVFSAFVAIFPVYTG